VLGSQASLADFAYSWTGATSNLWSEQTNWNPVGVPGAGDTLAFPQTLFNTQQVNDLASGITFNSIVFNGSGYRIGGNAIGLTGGVTAGFLFGKHVRRGDHAGGRPDARWRRHLQRTDQWQRPREGPGDEPGSAAVGHAPVQRRVDGKLHLLNASLPNASMDLAPNAFPSAQLSATVRWAVRCGCTTLRRANSARRGS
jgi:hypothetical protein